MDFDLQPTLKGELVELKPLLPEDFEALYLAASDPLIWEVHPVPTRYQRPVFEKLFHEQLLRSKGALKIMEKKSGRIIGTSSFYDLNESEKSVIIGYTFLTREFWGGKYNQEIKGLMLEHAFKTVDQVLFQVGQQNFRSQRALEKIGAKKIGSYVKVSPDGIEFPNFTYQIKKS